MSDTEINKTIAAIIVNRDRSDLTDHLVKQLKSMSGNFKMDIFVVDMGSEEPSKHTNIRYEDKDFRGKCYGHNVGLNYVNSKGEYDFYWFLMNDVQFKSTKVAATLLETSEKHPEIGVLSPAEPEGNYPDCKPRGSNFHIVSTCDYLCLFIKKQCVINHGFLNPGFKYCWGAIHEYAHKINKDGFMVAYCDKTEMKHLGSTTYGKVKNVISKQKYRENARKFAARYFVEHYGKNWDEIFSKALPQPVKINTFKLHRKMWEKAITESERKLFNQTYGDDLVSKIDSLAPWFYPVKIGNIQVFPGNNEDAALSIGGNHLIERTEYRKHILYDEVVKRYNFKDKSLLDIASNCAYWSSLYVKAGAKSMLAVEGRLDYIKQGELYWGENKFLPENSYKFIHANVLDKTLWEILSENSFDFSLCCGILYHVAEHETLLKNIASVTKEAILIDTRISDKTSTIEEPGGWCFDAIVETSSKSIPTLNGLKRLLSDLGFTAELLKTDTPMPKLMSGAENYQNGSRVCILAKRRK